MEITFEQLPKAVTQLCEDIAFIKQHLLSKTDEHRPETDELLTVQDAATLLRLSVPTIYGLISKGDLPVMKRSKRCYFSKIELLNYLKEGRKKTNAEIDAAAQNFVTRKTK